MKLSRIPGTEPTVKHSFSFRQSTSDQLTAYQAFIQGESRTEVALKDLAEQMLIDFMNDDKDFQRELKRRSESGASGRGARDASASASNSGLKGAAGATDPTF